MCIIITLIPLHLVSETYPRDVCDLQTVLKDSTTILTSNKGPKTHEAASRNCVK
jgi:hypothetical protein